MKLLRTWSSAIGLVSTLPLLLGLGLVASLSLAGGDGSPEAVGTGGTSKGRDNSGSAVKQGIDPFVPGSEISSQLPTGGDPIGVRITTFLEVFSMPRQQITELLLNQTTSVDMQNIVEELRRKSRDENSNCRIEHQAAVTVVPGAEGKTDSAYEMIYPTEYEADGGIPSEHSPQRVIAPTGKVLPTSFETRNVGPAFIVTPVLVRDGEWVAADITWEYVTFNGTAKYDGGVEQTKFTSLRVDTELVAKPGETVFVGLVHPQREDPPTPAPDLVSAVFVRFLVAK